MKIYFLSSQPCELTLNGIFFGITDRFERFVNVDLSDRIYASFSPQGALPVGVFLDDNLVHAPPEGVEIYLLQDAVAVYVKDFPPADCTLLPITQSRFDDTLVTVFKQGAVHLSIERGKELFISTLPPSFSNPTLSMHANFLFVEGENTLAVYTKDGKRIFFEQILSFFVEGTTLNATLPLSDRLNRVAECVWELEENGCTQTKFTIRQTGALPRQNSSIPLAKALLSFRTKTLPCPRKIRRKIPPRSLCRKISSPTHFLKVFCSAPTIPSSLATN